MDRRAREGAELRSRTSHSGEWPPPDTVLAWVGAIYSWANVLEMHRERPAVLGQTTSRSKSANSRGIVIIASWPVGSWRSRHPASLGGSALGASRRRMSGRRREKTSPLPVHSMCVRDFVDTIAGFFRCRGCSNVFNGCGVTLLSTQLRSGSVVTP